RRDANRPRSGPVSVSRRVGEVDGDLRIRIQKALVEGDNRLKQGADTARARQSWDRALELAREAGVEEQIAPLVEVRLADLQRLGWRPDVVGRRRGTRRLVRRRERSGRL